MNGILRLNSLKSRFLTALTGFIVLFGLALAVVSVLATQSIDAQAAASQQLTANLSAFSRLQRTLLDAAALTHNTLCFDDQESLSNIDAAVDGALAEAESAFASSSLIEPQSALGDIRAEWDAIVAAERAGLLQDEPNLVELQAGVSARFATISALLSDTYEMVRIHTSGQLGHAQGNIRGVISGLAILGVLALAAALVSLLSLNRRILVPLQLLRDGADRWHAGDFSHRLTIASRDEFGDVSHVMNEMVERLSLLVSDLEDQSAHDPLTGLYNRRTFDARLAQEITRASRYQRPLSLLMIDADHFSQVNNQHGHVVGDHVLKVIAQRIRANVRAADLPCRYGGEEFAVLLPETPAGGALELASRIREAVACPIADAGIGRTLRVTVSVGVALWTSATPRPEAFVAAADAALYEAKELGRDRVRFQRAATVAVPAATPVEPGEVQTNAYPSGGGQ